MSTPIPVLIVGAGPTGLALAALFSRLEIPYRIIDKNSARSIHSKALGVQAGTLETVEALFGKKFAGEWVTCGRPVSHAYFHVDDRLPIPIDLGRFISPPYNFILILPQNETERLLETQLTTPVERQYELISFSQNLDGISCHVHDAQGQEEDILASYVVGCDGSHSTVRHQTGIPFEGAAYDGDFILGDVKVESAWQSGSVQAYASKQGMMAGFPLPQEGCYRLMLVPRQVPAPADTTISFEEFERNVRRLCSTPMTLSEPTWLSRFHLNHRMVRTYRQGRIFLAGDAAHIHSPVGGQGMNIGMQDAFNLGIKLARVLQDKALEQELESYEQERKPVAQQVVQGTDRIFKWMLAPETILTQTLRHYLFPHLLGTAFFQSRAARAMSQIQPARTEITRYPQ